MVDDPLRSHATAVRKKQSDGQQENAWPSGSAAAVPGDAVKGRGRFPCEQATGSRIVCPARGVSARKNGRGKQHGHRPVRIGQRRVRGLKAGLLPVYLAKPGQERRPALRALITQPNLALRRPPDHPPSCETIRLRRGRHAAPHRTQSGRQHFQPAEPQPPFDHRQTARRDSPRTASAMARMCAGVVPQHPAHDVEPALRGPFADLRGERFPASSGKPGRRERVGQPGVGVTGKRTWTRSAPVPRCTGASRSAPARSSARCSAAARADTLV